MIWYRFIKIIVRLNLLFIEGISLFVELSSISVEVEQIILKESCMGSQKNKNLCFSLEALIVKNNRIHKICMILSAGKIRAYYNIIQINQHQISGLTNIFQDLDTC